MNERIQNRSDELKAEYNAGKEHLLELERQAISVRETMLRIEGAIRVLEELQSQEEHSGEAGEEE